MSLRHDVHDLRTARVERDRLRGSGAGRERTKWRRFPIRGRPLRAGGLRERRATCTAAAVPAEADERGNPCRSNQQSRRPVPLPAASRPPARLLDQRLQVGDALFEIAILLDLWPARRRGDGQGDSIRMTLQ